MKNLVATISEVAVGKWNNGDDFSVTSTVRSS